MGNIPSTQPAVFQMTMRVNRDEDGDDVVMGTEQWSLQLAGPGFKSQLCQGLTWETSLVMKCRQHHLLYRAAEAS